MRNWRGSPVTRMHAAAATTSLSSSSAPARASQITSDVMIGSCWVATALMGIAYVGLVAAGWPGRIWVWLTAGAILSTAVALLLIVMKGLLRSTANDSRERSRPLVLALFREAKNSDNAFEGVGPTRWHGRPMSKSCQPAQSSLAQSQPIRTQHRVFLSHLGFAGRSLSILRTGR